MVLGKINVERAHFLKGNGSPIYPLVAAVAMVASDHGARVDLSEVYEVAEVAVVYIDPGDLGA